MPQNIKDICKNTKTARIQKDKIDNSLYPIKMFQHIKKQNNMTRKRKEASIQTNPELTYN